MSGSLYAKPDEDGAYEFNYTKEQQESHDVQPWRDAGSSSDVSPNKPYDKLSVTREDAGSSSDVSPNKPYDKLSVTRENAGTSPDVTPIKRYDHLSANRGNVTVSPSPSRDKDKVYEVISTGGNVAVSPSPSRDKDKVYEEVISTEGGGGMFTNLFTGNVFEEVTVDSLIKEAASPRGNTTGTSSNPSPNKPYDTLNPNRGNAGTSCNPYSNEYAELNLTKGPDTCSAPSRGRRCMKHCMVIALVILMLALAGGNVYLISELRSEINELKHLKSQPVKQSRLPGGYATYSVEDLQWQTLHMAVAAACRASGTTDTTAAQPGVVIPRNTKHNCDQICSSHSPGLGCDSTVHLIGYTGRSKNYTSEAGRYFSSKCGEITSGEEFDEDIQVANYYKCVGYCCCRYKAFPH